MCIGTVSLSFVVELLGLLELNRVVVDSVHGSIFLALDWGIVDSYFRVWVPYIAASSTVEMVDIIRMLLSSSMFEELLSTVCLLELCRLAGPLVGRVWVQSW